MHDTYPETIWFVLGHGNLYVAHPLTLAYECPVNIRSLAVAGILGSAILPTSSIVLP